MDGLAEAAGHADRKAPVQNYCRGLLLPGERKSVEPMAARIAPDDVRRMHQSLHHVVADAPWSDAAVLAAVRKQVLPAMLKTEPVVAWACLLLADFHGRMPELLEDVLQRKLLRYDKAGEEHFNLISALHKSVRNSDPDAALYWLSRMLESGEDPLYLARRMVRMASEDIGLAEPGALAVTLAAKDAFDFLGAPEGHLALAQAAVYLSLAPKSNAVYTAFGNVADDVRKTEADPVPLHLRNAVTGLMKNIGYGEGYKYAHNFEEKVTDMSCLPDNLAGRVYYKPTSEGFEQRLRQRLEEIRKLKVRSKANSPCEK